MNTIENAKAKEETYFKGDKARFNGTINTFYGGTFGEAEMIEGTRKGQIVDIKVD